ncbi:hypothetical protein [Shimazuella kribbensis]|uniref:hypothetical protein n=1 Tax=Shimazuella kribbensis TaxID=139808 RepID=UPI0003FA45B5|nr:hypothetical protein [Shimazuella kribbensis]
MREVYPVKYYSKKGFVERTIEINEEDLEEIIEEYLLRHAKFDFDEIELVNNRPFNIWLHAKCRTFLPEEDPELSEAYADADIEIERDYDGNPLIGGV